MDIREGAIFVILALMVAGYLLLGLLLLAHALFGFVMQLRAAVRSVKRPAHANRPGRQSKEVCESGVPERIRRGGASTLGSGWVSVSLPTKVLKKVLRPKARKRPRRDAPKLL